MRTARITAKQKITLKDSFLIRRVLDVDSWTSNRRAYLPTTLRWASAAEIEEEWSNQSTPYAKVIPMRV